MHLLQSGVPFNIIVLWLCHESTNTTHRYVEATLETKEKALARLEAPDIKPQRARWPGLCWLLAPHLHVTLAGAPKKATSNRGGFYVLDLRIDSTGD